MDKDLELVINGDIYIKRGPKKLPPKPKVTSLDKKISEIEFGMSKEDPDFNQLGFLEFLKQARDNTQIDNDEDRYDYSGTDVFWQLYTEDGKNIQLYAEIGPFEEVKNFTSKEDLDKQFIRLVDFMKNAEFIGKETLSKSALGPPLKYIVLFGTKDLLLVKGPNVVTGVEEYSLVRRDDQKFLGPVHKEYRDISKVYSDICRQLTKRNKNKGMRF